MSTAQLQLSDQETEGLEALSHQTGKTKDQLLHEAIAALLSRSTGESRLDLMKKARGMWKGRTDIPSLSDIRREFDRTF